jgi:hypothetical protein
MTLMKSMASLHQGPKVSKAKLLNMLLNMQFDEIIELNFTNFQNVTVYKCIYNSNVPN